jgi:hypothetical protein
LKVNRVSKPRNKTSKKCKHQPEFKPAESTPDAAELATAS